MQNHKNKHKKLTAVAGSAALVAGFVAFAVVAELGIQGHEEEQYRDVSRAFDREDEALCFELNGATPEDKNRIQAEMAALAAKKQKFDNLYTDVVERITLKEQGKFNFREDFFKRITGRAR